MYNQAIYKCAQNRLQRSIDALDSTLVEDLRQHLPHWTPSTGDKFVYTRSHVEEAMSANITDVATYLDKLKVDLHIGEEGYPNKVILTGDQQTFKLTKDLQIKYPSRYNWFYAAPGDWHLLKLTGELIKGILWDGGFKQMCVECGYKKDITQWVDIYLMLSSLHEVLLRISTSKYKNTCNDGDIKFWAYIDSLMEDTNNDEVSRFWAEMLKILNTYMGLYFAIRSGFFTGIDKGCTCKKSNCKGKIRGLVR